MKHFTLTNKTLVHCSITLYQIKATKDLPCGVKEADLGGYIQHEDQLQDNAWVSINALV